MKWLVSPVLQLTAMDCGPAALLSAARGFGLQFTYDEVRERCGTNADGTTLTEIEQAAGELGLVAEEQLITESELLRLVRHSPVLLTTRGPFGTPHIVLAWRRLGRWVQIMDPAEGRRWLTVPQLRASLLRVSTQVEASAFEEFVRQDGFATSLLAELAGLLPPYEAQQLLQTATNVTGWQGLARLDALVRYVSELRNRFDVSLPQVKQLLRDGMRPGSSLLIPQRCYYGTADTSEAQPDNGVVISGCAVVRLTPPKRLGAALGPEPMRGPEAAHATPTTEPAPTTPNECAADSRNRTPSSPPQMGALARALWVLRSVGTSIPSRRWVVLAVVSLLVGLLHVAEGLLLGALVDVLGQLAQPLQRVLAVLYAAGLVVILGSLETPLTYRALRLGSRLDVALRREISEKLVRLEAQYFEERPAGDAVERAHVLHGIRGVPVLLLSAIRLLVGWLATSAAMVWINPDCAWILVGSIVVSIAVPTVTAGLLVSRDVQFRDAAAELSHRYFDCLQGLGAILAQGAVSRERERAEPLLQNWRAVGKRMIRAALLLELLVAATATAITAALFLQYVTSAEPQRAGGFLYLYWAACFPSFGREFSLLAKQVPSLVSLLSRLAEPLLNARPETPKLELSGNPSRAVKIEFDEVKVNNLRADILRRVHVTVAAGEHVAVVGSSGAGKSSVLSLLLGLLNPSSGQIRIDGQPLNAEVLQHLRQRTTWLDPSVHLWNTSLLSNLLYGAPVGQVPIGQCVQEADLTSLIENLPRGLQGPLGEAGCAISGGEGQRVRLARAICQARTGLVLFDEPFRGLDRDVRGELLQRARKRFAASTFLCVTHDIADALTFPRVLVMNGGEIGEVGTPQELLKRPDSLLSAMLHSEQLLQQSLTTSGRFRDLRLRRGRVVEVVQPPLTGVVAPLHVGAAE